MSNDELFINAIDAFGIQNQMYKTVEEAAEFVQALMKYCLNPTEESVNHLFEEIADLEIMIEQVKLMLGKTKANEKISEFKEYKLERLERRISKFIGELK